MKSRAPDNLLKKVRTLVDEAANDRSRMHNNWLESMALAQGIRPDDLKKQGTGLPTDVDSSPETTTLIMENVRKYYNKLIAGRMMPEVIPRSGSWRDQQSALKANDLILHFWENPDNTAALEASKLNLVVLGTSIEGTVWDQMRGAEVDVSVEQMQDVGYGLKAPVLNREMARTGLPAITSISPWRFIPEPRWQNLTVSGCNYYAIQTVMPRSVARLRWPKAKLAKSVMNSTRGLVQALYGGLVRKLLSFDSYGAHSMNEDTVEIYDFYHAPSILDLNGTAKRFNRGFRLIFCDEEVLFYSERLLYDRFPHVSITDRPMLETGWGLSLVDFLKKPQTLMDQAGQSIADIITRQTPREMVPAGEEVSNVVGSRFEFSDKNRVPFWGAVPVVGNDTLAVLGIADQMGERLSGVAAPVGGVAPGRGDSAAYLDRLLAENEIARTHPIHRIEAANAHHAQLLILLSNDYLPKGYRFAAVSSKTLWEHDEPIDIGVVRVVPGSAANTYPDAIRTALLTLVSNGIIKPDQPMTDMSYRIASTILGEPIAKSFGAVAGGNSQELAIKNIERMMAGEPPFFRQWLNAETHIRITRDFMDSYNFSVLPERFQVLFENHLASLQSIILSSNPAGSVPSAPGPELSPQGSGTSGVPAFANGFTGRLGGPAEA